MTPSAGGVLSLKHTVDTSSMKNASQRCLKSVFLLIEVLYGHTEQIDKHELYQLLQIKLY